MLREAPTEKPILGEGEEKGGGGVCPAKGCQKNRLSASIISLH